MKKNPLVSIVIANYNGEKFLEICLKSLLKTKYNPFEILIVDDGSTDSSLKIIERFIKEDKRIHLTKNNINKGAAARRNEAIKLVQGEIIVFLDNDTEVDISWLMEMVKTLSSQEKIAACQAKIIDFKNRKIIQMAGAKLWASTGWGLPIGQWADRKKFNDQEDIVAISAALAVKKEVLEIIGGFDEDEAVVTEDLDLSWRIWIAGFRIVLCPDAIVYHWTKNVKMRKNMKHSAGIIYYHLTKNSFISILKNYGFLNSLKYFATSLIISLGRGVLVFYTRHDVGPLVSTFNAFVYIISNIPYTLEKRKSVQKTRKISDEELFRLVIVKENVMSIYRKYFTQTNLL